MKKAKEQLCDSCSKRGSCQDYVDNMQMRSEGLIIHIVECDMHIPAAKDSSSSSFISSSSIKTPGFKPASDFA